MTTDSDFKALVRQRMAKTGEAYAAARAQLVGRRANGFGDLVAALDDAARKEQASIELRGALPRSCDAVLRGLTHGSPPVRAACAAILDHAPHDERVERALLAALEDSHWRVRKAVLHALSCAECKPDGCLTTDGVGALVDRMLNDPDRRVRLMCAGSLMHGQAGREQRITEAFRRVLATSTNVTMRHRAAFYLAALELPRDEGTHGAWLAAFEQRIVELRDV
jgi:HEAT repeat protein